MSRSTAKDDEQTHKYTHMLKIRIIMRNNRGNALQPLKTYIQPSGGRNECSNASRDAPGVPIYKLTRRKLKKMLLRFSCATSCQVHAMAGMLCASQRVLQ